MDESNYRFLYRHYRVPYRNPSTLRDEPHDRPIFGWLSDRRSRRVVEHAEEYCDRYYRRGPNRSDWQPHPRGGMTDCHVFSQDGKRVATARAWCSPVDAFSYAIGRSIARGRAVKKLERRDNGD